MSIIAIDIMEKREWGYSESIYLLNLHRNWYTGYKKQQIVNYLSKISYLCNKLDYNYYLSGFNFAFNWKPLCGK